MLRGTEVDAIDPLSAVLLPQHQHLLALAINGQVTGFAYGIKNSHVVAFNLDTPWIVYLTQDRDSKVDEFHRNHWILNQFLLLELSGQLFGNLLAGHSLYPYLSQNRKINVAVGIYCIAGYSSTGA